MYMSPEGRLSIFEHDNILTVTAITGTTKDNYSAMDVWSLGCVILEAATGRKPWVNLDNEWAIMWNIAGGQKPQLPAPEQLSPAGIDFLNRCFERDPSKRATAAELLQHEWVRMASQYAGISLTPSPPENLSVKTPGPGSPLTTRSLPHGLPRTRRPRSNSIPTDYFYTGRTGIMLDKAKGPAAVTSKSATPSMLGQVMSSTDPSPEQESTPRASTTAESSKPRALPASLSQSRSTSSGSVVSIIIHDAAGNEIPQDNTDGPTSSSFSLLSGLSISGISLSNSSSFSLLNDDGLAD